MDIEAWLQGLGLGRYVPAFRDNEIDGEVLPKLTSEDLREIGVARAGTVSISDAMVRDDRRPIGLPQPWLHGP